MTPITDALRTKQTVEREIADIEEEEERLQDTIEECQGRLVEVRARLAEAKLALQHCTMLYDLSLLSAEDRLDLLGDCPQTTKGAWWVDQGWAHCITLETFPVQYRVQWRPRVELARAELLKSPPVPVRGAI
ncbi:hypothetical protein EBT31_03960 [bacterium]|nr:hypothetical protein [bacterium]